MSVCVKRVCAWREMGGCRYAIDLLWSQAAGLAVLLLACRPSGDPPSFLPIVPLIR